MYIGMSYILTLLDINRLSTIISLLHWLPDEVQMISGVHGMKQGIV